MCSFLWWKALRSTSSYSACAPLPTPDSRRADFVHFTDILLLEPNPRRDRRFRVKTISLENSRRTHQHRYVPLTHEDVTTDRRVCRFLAVVAFGWENTVQGCSVPLYEHVREGSVGTCHLAILEMAYQEGRLKRYAFDLFPEPHAHPSCG